MTKTTGTHKMKAGDAVYVIGRPEQAIGGVPGMLCGIIGATARVTIELEEGTRSLMVPVSDLLPARLFAASVLRIAYGVYKQLGQERRSMALVSPDELTRALQNAHLDAATARNCAELATREVDWIKTPCPLRAWLNAIRKFYYPPMA
jgi:hypothetical protein